jgi:hypothetical protein
VARCRSIELRDQLRYWRIGAPQQRYSLSSRSRARTTSIADLPLIVFSSKSKNHLVNILDCSLKSAPRVPVQIRKTWLPGMLRYET